jgi:hypothetical protein
MIPSSWLSWSVASLIDRVDDWFIFHSMKLTDLYNEMYTESDPQRSSILGTNSSQYLSGDSRIVI